MAAMGLRYLVVSERVGVLLHYTSIATGTLLSFVGSMRLATNDTALGIVLATVGAALIYTAFTQYEAWHDYTLPAIPDSTTRRFPSEDSTPIESMEDAMRLTFT